MKAAFALVIRLNEVHAGQFAFDRFNGTEVDAQTLPSLFELLAEWVNTQSSGVTYFDVFDRSATPQVNSRVEGVAAIRQHARPKAIGLDFQHAFADGDELNGLVHKMLSAILALQMRDVLGCSMQASLKRVVYLTMAGILGLKVQPGIKYCMAMASLRAPKPCCK